MDKKGLLLQERQMNTPDIIANRLRKEILAGRYQENEPLRQDHIARELGISKIPLREALVQLKMEGLVHFLPKRGAVVAELSSAEVEEIYVMRVALESIALERAIPHLTHSDIIRARSILEILESEPKKEEWGDLNWEFHAILYKPAGLAMLLNTINGLHNNVARYLTIYLDQLSASEVSQKEHYQILDACQQRDAGKAKRVLKKHLQKASDSLIGHLHGDGK